MTPCFEFMVDEANCVATIEQMIPFALDCMMQKTKKDQRGFAANFHHQRRNERFFVHVMVRCN